MNESTEPLDCVTSDVSMENPEIFEGGVDSPPMESQEGDVPEVIPSAPQTFSSDIPMPLSVGDFAGDPVDGYYLVGHSVLGDITLYTTYNYSSNSFSLDSDGLLVNVSGSTVTFYCLEYPSYSFRAGPLEGVSYRNNSSSSYLYSALRFVPSGGTVSYRPSHLSNDILSAAILCSVLVVGALLAFRLRPGRSKGVVV